MSMQVTEETYKGKPILCFQDGANDKFPTRFGVRKCRIILENIEVIRSFYERNKASTKPRNGGYE